jgi:hypothetical protein
VPAGSTCQTLFDIALPAAHCQGESGSRALLREGEQVPEFKVAHIREQGVDLIIIPVDNSFDCKSSSEQNEIAHELQMRASSAGLRGTVVPVWGNGRSLKFLAPQGYHPFFRGISMSFVAANINRKIYW